MNFVDRDPHYYSWAAGEGSSCRPIMLALREAGFLAQIGSRRTPPENFEVRCLATETDLTTGIIETVDPSAYRLYVGR